MCLGLESLDDPTSPVVDQGTPGSVLLQKLSRSGSQECCFKLSLKNATVSRDYILLVEGSQRRGRFSLEK